MTTRPARSLAAGLALFLGLLAGVGLTISQAQARLSGYVSEAGVPGSRFALLYQLSVVAIAVTAGLLSFALWPQRRPTIDGKPPQYGWIVTALLAIAAPMVAVSAAITCTDGCPLPPYDATTSTDLAHAVASVIGVGCCALAMLALAWQGSGRLRTVSIIAVLTGWPVLLATAIGIVAVGRGSFTGVLERIGLTACVAWLVAVAAVLLRPLRQRPDRMRDHASDTGPLP